MRLVVRTLLLALLSAVAGVVHAATSTITLAVSPNPARFGEMVTLAATVTPAGATGSVTFYGGVTVLGSSPLSSGRATLRLSALDCGAQALMAFYAGDASYTASTSAAVRATVNSVSAKGFLVASQPSLAQAGLQFPSLALGDFNGDGKLDLAATGAVPGATSLAIFLGKGDGTFAVGQIYPGATHGISIVAADFNRDGKTDLAYMDETAATLRVRLGNGDGTFQSPTTSAVNGTLLIAADFNSDGIVDLATSQSSFANGGIRILLGRGDGTFNAPVTIPVANGAGAMVAADLNGDGVPDLVVQEGAGNVQVYIGKRDGTFSALGSPIVLAKPVGGLAAADFNGDGRIDLAISSGSSVSLAIGDGNGGFGTPKSFAVGRSTGMLSVADFNGDGNLDVVAATGFPDSSQMFGSFAVLDGDGAGGLTLDPFHDGFSSANPLAVADFNGDGRVDIVEGFSTPAVYLGTAPTDLTVSLTHSGNFLQGQKDAVLTASVGNLGSGATAGDVSLDFTLPGGLSITKFNATGWRCFGTQCTRSDSLAAGAAFPPVSLTLSVSAIAAPSLRPAAKVSINTMSDPEPSNDAAEDVIKVTQYQTIVFGTLADLVIGVAPFPLAATATSGLPVTYAASGDCAVADGVVTVTGAGVCSIRASQAGNDLYLAAPDVIRTFTIGAAATAVALAAEPPSVLFGAPVTLIAAVSPAAAQGRVAFYDGTALLGIADVSQGSAKLMVNTIATGRRRIRARYLASPPWPGSTSATVNVTVTSAPAFIFSSSPTQQDFGGFDVAAGDFNGDGFPDVLEGGANLVVFPGDGAGHLGAGISTSMTGPFQPIAHLAVGDFNGDGKLDVLTSQGSSPQTTVCIVWLGRGDGTFTLSSTVAVAGVSIVAADFNGDGLADVAIGHTSPLAVSVLLSKGDGTFEAPIEYPISGIGTTLLLAAGDFNRDGATDLAAVAAAPYSSTARTRVNLLMGRGDGTFLQPAGWIDDGDIADNPAQAIAAGDIDGDGIPDLVLQDDYRFGPGRCSITTLVSNGDGTFQTPGHWLCSGTSQVSAAGRAAGLAIADFTGDGKPDIAALFTYNDGYLHLFAGNGDGTFQPASVYDNFFNVLSQQGLADFDRDGTVDLAGIRGGPRGPAGLQLGRPGPALRLSLTHTAKDEPGQDITWTISVSNAAGATSTSGPVTATSSLLNSSNSNGGPGWTCGVAGCTRSDALGAGVAFPPITVLTRTGPFFTGETISHAVTVSGGGSAPNASLDTFRLSPSNGLITSVNTVGGSPNVPGVAPNAWVEIHGINLVPATTPASGVIWSSAPEFASGRMPTEIAGVSVTVNNKPAYIYFYCSAATSAVCSTDQINVLLPPDLSDSPASIVVKRVSGNSVEFESNLGKASPAFLRFGATRFVAATHADYSLIGPATLYPGASTPARRGETIAVWAVGFGLPVGPLTAGSASQSGTLPEKLTCTVGARPAAASIALVSPGLYQINLTIPSDAPPGDNPPSCIYGSFSTPDGAILAVQ